MGLSIGIVGLPNVGKSTLFNALTKKSVDAANFPFCTIDPSVGVVAVPDSRLWTLSEFSSSKKTIPAAIEFVDIAGLVKGASEGEGLGNKFLSNIRETDAIAQVVRLFVDDDITHVHNEVNPLSDIEVINLELILADQQTVAKRLNSITRDVKRGDKNAIKEESAIKKIEETLNQGKLANMSQLTDEEKEVIQSLHLLTMKPFLYVLNKKSGGINIDTSDNSEHKEKFEKLLAFFKETSSHYVIVDANIESEIRELEGEEKDLFRKELGATDDGINNLITEGYRMLSLMTYFTTGEDETRAWTISVGSTAPVAGSAIHTDFKDKFIRAEIVFWKDLLEAGSYARAREKGLIRTEGKEYVVKDGDVIEFKV
ncbi:MAG: redox-regulated ATPase YchF [Candidatus Paceibacterota bacterium]